LEGQERRHYLDRHREAWSQGRRLREFLSACEASLVGRRGEPAPDGSEAKWPGWARRDAERVDPLKNGSFEEVILRLVRKAEGP
jgi:hypothetical protein